ncbi:MAG: hypothetical protein HUU15_12225, partial [Candidatus Brocadiae bacterium]|nr:hypothetical protein [Candidatus Brocadiia bacterium]
MAFLCRGPAVCRGCDVATKGKRTGEDLMRWMASAVVTAAMATVCGATEPGGEYREMRERIETLDRELGRELRGLEEAGEPVVIVTAMLSVFVLLMLALRFLVMMGMMRMGMMSTFQTEDDRTGREEQQSLEEGVRHE